MFQVKAFSQDKVINSLIYLFAAVPLFLLVSKAAADVAFTLVGLLFLYHSYRSKQWAWAAQPIFMVSMVLYVYLLASAALADHDAGYALGKAAVFFRYPLFLMAAIYLAQNEKESVLFIAKSTLVVVFIAALDCIYQLLTGTSISGQPLFDGYRLTSFLSRPDIGNFMTKLFFPSFAVMLALTLTYDKPRWKIFTFISLALVPAAVLLSGERSMAVMSLLGGVVFLFLMAITYPKIRLRIVGAAVVVAILLGGLFVSQDRISGRADLLVEQVSEFSETVYGKLFESGYQVFSQHPVTGVGVRNFWNFCPEVSSDEEACSTHPHNFYIEWLAETGFIGFTGLLILITLMMLHLRKCAKEARADEQQPSYRLIVLTGGWVTLLIVFFPFVVTMSFFSNWSAILNWYAVSLAFAGTAFLVKRI